MKSRREILDEFYKTLPGTYKVEWVKESDLPKKKPSPIHLVMVGEKP